MKTVWVVVGSFKDNSAQTESPDLTMASPPAWLQEMANLAAAQIEPTDILSPIGCHFVFADGLWEVTVFASSTEVVGGQKDGVVRSSRFSLNLQGVCEIFSEITSFNWQTQPHDSKDELGAHVAIQGKYQGQPVWLRILAKPPKRFKPGRFARVYEMTWDEVW